MENHTGHVILFLTDVGPFHESSLFTCCVKDGCTGLMQSLVSDRSFMWKPGEHWCPECQHPQKVTITSTLLCPPMTCTWE